MSKKLIQLKNINGDSLDPININYESRLSNLEGTVLYNNASGSNTTIALNDSVTNYKYLEIVYLCNTYGYKSIKVPTVINTNIILDYIVPLPGNGLNQHSTSRFKIANNQLVYLDSGLVNIFYSSSLTSESGSQTIKITKVIGYKS